MNLYILTNRDNVEQRWFDISAGNCPQKINIDFIADQVFSANSCLLVHVDSFSKDQIASLCTFENEVHLIGFSDNPDDTQGIGLLLSGFKGYVNTFVAASVFEQLLSSVCKGDIWAGTSIVQKMIKKLLMQSDADHSISLSQFGLSEREKDTVNILITGASNKEIARKLSITERTVKAHVSSILRKTETSDRVSLVIKLKDSNS
ncbi:MAG: response regulator transcription factor [Oceanospirillaceae bacterium]